MTDRTIYCGNYRRVEDGQRLQGPLVRYEGKEREMKHKQDCVCVECEKSRFTEHQKAKLCNVCGGPVVFEKNATVSNCSHYITTESVTTDKAQQSQGDVMELITHKRNCAAWHSPDTGCEVNAEDCTCGYRYQIQLQTEQEMHKAWRKRGEEAEVENERLKVLLDEALGNPTQDEMLRHEAPWGHSCGDSALRDFLASRRSRILPESKQERTPDAAVEAASDVLNKYGYVRRDVDAERFAAEIVAAVRAADRK
jgi:hypothetical protein